MIRSFQLCLFPRKPLFGLWVQWKITETSHLPFSYSYQNYPSTSSSDVLIPFKRHRLFHVIDTHLHPLKCCTDSQTPPNQIITGNVATKPATASATVQPPINSPHHLRKKEDYGPKLQAESSNFDHQTIRPGHLQACGHRARVHCWNAG